MPVAGAGRQRYCHRIGAGSGKRFSRSRFKRWRVVGYRPQRLKAKGVTFEPTVADILMGRIGLAQANPHEESLKSVIRRAGRNHIHEAGSE